MPITLPHTFVDGPGNVASGVQVMNNLNSVADQLSAVYKTLEEVTFALHDLETANSGILWANQGAMADANFQLVGKIGSPFTRAAPAFFPFDPADFAIAGKTLRLRLRMALVTNPTAPAANFTAGMHSFTSQGGADLLGLSPAAAVAGSTVARNAPAATSVFNDVGADFAAPVAGAYMLGLNLSGAIAANAVVAAKLMLQFHHV